MNCTSCGRELQWETGSYDWGTWSGATVTLPSTKIGNCGNGCAKEVDVPRPKLLDMMLRRLGSFEGWQPRPRRLIVRFDEKFEEWVISGVGL